VLNEEAQETLDQVVRTLVNHPEIDLEIHGYTDNMGDRNYNIMLSQQRADSVMNYLIDNGIEPERLSAEGFGPDNPIASNDSKEGRAQNRRIEFIRKD
ncbi:MAG: OmpA family protein, partial [Candidatus Cloacimonetes bacterium]|nr:OmpA family protein [Candidatus Cloacimonadota bacterium]